MGKQGNPEKNKARTEGLVEGQMEKSPFDQFERWFKEVQKAGFIEPTAMILATSTKTGIPSVRTLLLKDFSESGFVFYTNYNSRKGQDLTQNPKAALLFYWDMLARQVRVRGTVKKVSGRISEEYFNSRPWQSRISAIASPQSEIIKDRLTLEKKVDELNSKFSGQENIPCPANWGGYVLKPNYFEFWQGRENRLHDRIIYVPGKGKWKMSRLAP